MTKQRITRPVILIFVINYILIGCQPLFCNWVAGYNKITTEPNKMNITGIYNLNKRSIKFLIDQGYKVDGCFIELKKDGYFNLANVPDFVFNPSGEYNFSYETKTGKWHVTRFKEDGFLMELEGVCVEPFLQHQERFAISITIGDPDDCEGIIFEKINE